MAAITHPIPDSKRHAAARRAISVLLTSVVTVLGLTSVADSTSQPDQAPLVEMTPTGTTIPHSAPSTIAVNP